MTTEKTPESSKEKEPYVIRVESKDRGSDTTMIILTLLILFLAGLMFFAYADVHKFMARVDLQLPTPQAQQQPETQGPLGGLPNTIQQVIPLPGGESRREEAPAEQPRQRLSERMPGTEQQQQQQPAEQAPAESQSF